MTIPSFKMYMYLPHMSWASETCWIILNILTCLKCATSNEGKEGNCLLIPLPNGSHRWWCQSFYDSRSLFMESVSHIVTCSLLSTNCDCQLAKTIVPYIVMVSWRLYCSLHWLTLNIHSIFNIHTVVRCVLQSQIKLLSWKQFSLQIM